MRPPGSEDPPKKGKLPQEAGGQEQSVELLNQAQDWGFLASYGIALKSLFRYPGHWLGLVLLQSLLFYSRSGVGFFFGLMATLPFFPVRSRADFELMLADQALPPSLAPRGIPFGAVRILKTTLLWPLAFFTSFILGGGKLFLFLAITGYAPAVFTTVSTMTFFPKRWRDRFLHNRSVGFFWYFHLTAWILGLAFLLGFVAPMFPLDGFAYAFLGALSFDAFVFVLSVRYAQALAHGLDSPTPDLPEGKVRALPAFARGWDE